MKILKAFILAVFAGIMIFAVSDLPYRGHADNLMNAQESIAGTKVIGSYAIQNAYQDARTPNFVTVILGDYRAVDTFGEQLVIYTAGMVVFLLFVTNRRKDEK